MFRFFYIGLVCSLFSGCHNVPVFNSWMFDHPPPGKEYPPIYVTGWQDGCETGAAVGANALYRFRYEFRQDWQLVTDRVYYAGWKDAVSRTLVARPD